MLLPIPRKSLHVRKNRSAGFSIREFKREKNHLEIETQVDDENDLAFDSIRV